MHTHTHRHVYFISIDYIIITSTTIINNNILLKLKVNFHLNIKHSNIDFNIITSYML